MKKEESTKQETKTLKIDNYIFKSEETLYKVLRCSDIDDNEFVVVGNFPTLEEGLYYDFYGEFITHKKYGVQFMATTYSKSKSFTKEGIISYLSSDRFKGVGVKLATNIVDKIGNDCIDKILENPDILDEVSGLNKTKKDVIVNVLKSNFAVEQMYIRLYGYSLTAKMIKRLYDVYGENAANIVEDNPYILINDVEGFGFKKCDTLAMNLKFKNDDIRRIKAAILYTLNVVCYQQGFTYLTTEQLINSSKKLLNDESIDITVFESAVEMLINDDKIICEENRCFDKILYQAELNITDKLIKISKTKIKGFSKEKIKEALKYIESLTNINYTPLQKEAIENALYNKLSIITGGPGTGKSTILNGILKCYAYLNNLSIGCDELDYKVMLAAPTGRAAKRMSETTNLKSSTIHKALGYNFEGGFNYNEHNPLAKSLVVIDEASMLDVTLAASLFSALPNTVQIILVGDVNQLPSVGPGNVLYDLISTDIFITTRLSQIMRQANDSDIIKLSHMILAERIDYSIFSRRKEIFFYDYESQSIIEGIFKMLDNFIKSGGNLLTDIQILAPMYAGVAGIDMINQKIQQRYNPETEKKLVRDEKIFKKNDKVLQLKNDSELDIMNGDIGRILDVVKEDDKEYLMIDFDSRVVKYPSILIDNLTLAYAISIHKSQGAEFKNVILPIVPSYYVMLKKKLVYTAVTRTKQKLIILGKIKSLDSAITNLEYQRQTTLGFRINNQNNISLENKIFDKDIPFDTLGEYDMEGITPYSFM